MEAPKQLLPMAQDPNSPSSSTSSSSPSSASPSGPDRHPIPPSPKPVHRTVDTTPYPTTFVQADTASFKQVVQMLTGAEPPTPKPVKNHHGDMRSHGGGNQSSGPCRPKKPAFKLYERRGSLKGLKMISPLAMAAAEAAGASPRKAMEALSPSVLDFPSLALSPVTPLVADPFNRSPPGSAAAEEAGEAERAAIAEKGFFLRPSPRGAEPPRLLPLFPVTSPRMASSAPSSE